MPIIQATEQHLTQACARCGAERAIAREDLRAGDHNESTQQPEPDICRLPPCPACGAVEFLVRTWDRHPEPESQAGLHRGLVNRLFVEMVRAGKVEERCAAAFLAETGEPLDIIPLATVQEGESPVTIEIGRPQGMGGHCVPLAPE